MNRFRQENKIKFLIVAVSLGVAVIVAPATFWILHREVNLTLLKFAREESNRVHGLLLKSFESTSAEGARSFAQSATSQLVNGLFDTADFYTNEGVEISQSRSETGALLDDESIHQSLNSTSEYQFTDKLSDGTLLRRFFLPVYIDAKSTKSQQIGFLELGRYVPPDRQTQLKKITIISVLLSVISALLCGVLMYPSIMKLLKNHRFFQREMVASRLGLIESMGRAVAKKEESTGVHNYRVAWIAVRIAEQLKISPHEIQNLIAGAFLHDVGKIGIPDAILKKPGALDEAEWDIMRQHVRFGEEIVHGIAWLEAGAASVVAGHHEKWDGTGYPNKVVGKSIPLLARVFAVADVFDALSSKRPYKKKFDFDDVIKIMREQSGKHFDPIIFSALDSIALDLYLEITDLTELEAKKLIEPSLKKYFYVDMDYFGKVESKDSQIFF